MTVLALPLTACGGSGAVEQFIGEVITGTFVHHCHILGHEDRGMMQLVDVVDG